MADTGHNDEHVMKGFKVLKVFYSFCWKRKTTLCKIEIIYISMHNNTASESSKFTEKLLMWYQACHKFCDNLLCQSTKSKEGNKRNNCNYIDQ